MDEFQKLNQLFNFNQLPVQSAEKKQNETVEDDLTDEEKKQSDFGLARQTIINMIDKNSDAIDDILRIAKNAESSRAFEVVGQLVKTQTELARELMNTHKQKKDIDGQSANNIKQQNNIVFAGSTSELMKMISAEKAKLIEPEN
jgi:hypothetical protein